jgi:hypothetical protein
MYIALHTFHKYFQLKFGLRVCNAICNAQTCNSFSKQINQLNKQLWHIHVPPFALAKSATGHELSVMSTTRIVNYTHCCNEFPCLLKAAILTQEKVSSFASRNLPLHNDIL